MGRILTAKILFKSIHDADFLVCELSCYTLLDTGTQLQEVYICTYISMFCSLENTCNLEYGILDNDKLAIILL